MADPNPLGRDLSPWKNGRMKNHPKRIKKIAPNIDVSIFKIYFNFF